ncbi:lactoylglutathione lyase [Geomicrobium halophilum]|uniref:Lactoylglutathione lyase n=1 Tax=Geomicrobium halophilum TaxID=549000 RepID=A0A841PR60_9BACL|nr:lactoylglutathione lyase [Geomicrobium halophilum]
MTNVHIGLNVRDLEKSKAFYENMLGVTPAKEKHDYIKFLTADPNLNLTLTPAEQVEGNHINHLGVQLGSKDEVTKHKERLEKVGFFAREEMDTTCC